MAGKVIDLLRLRAKTDEYERQRVGMPDDQILPDERVWALIEAVKAGDMVRARVQLG